MANYYDTALNLTTDNASFNFLFAIVKQILPGTFSAMLVVNLEKVIKD
jgi:hypothetical protein